MERRETKHCAQELRSKGGAEKKPLTGDNTNKEKDRRCYKCNAYGHISLHCDAETPTKNINIIQRTEEQDDDNDEENWDDIKMSSSDEERMYKKLYYQSKSRQ